MEGRTGSPEMERGREGGAVFVRATLNEVRLLSKRLAVTVIKWRHTALCLLLDPRTNYRPL
jgi:hypothetical protein